MSYRVEPNGRARAQLGGFPAEARDALFEILAEVAENPYDPLRTLATPGGEQVRQAVFGRAGIVTYTIDDGCSSLSGTSGEVGVAFAAASAG